LESGRFAIVPGDAAASELMRRISSDDPEVRMPPPDAKKTLTAEQIALLGRWIESGATWQEHWAWVAPVRPTLPNVARADWVNNPIDRFVLARLEEEGLQPSPPADRPTLIRRVS